jgi:glycosyltransferase involved in cell wall biosynthesis
VVVLDSGSTDGTPARARELGARVLEVDWPGFVAQKNRAAAACSQEWVLSIDADEVVSAELAASISSLWARGAPERAGYSVSRLSHWMGAPIRHGCWYPDVRPRLFHRGRARWAGEDPHDRLEVEGELGRLQGELLHHPYEDLREQLETIDRYAEIFVQQSRRRGRRARSWDLLIRPPAHLLKALLLRSGWLDGARGLCLAFLGATAVSLKWTRLYLEQERR